MSSRLAAAAVALVLLSVTAGGCGGDDEPEPAPGPRTVDPLKGTYRGIGLGNRPARVRSAFGTPAPSSPEAGIAPVGTTVGKIGGPPKLRPPRRPAAYARTTLRYEGVTFLARTRVYALLVSKENAHTTEGVGIGSRLSEVQASYDDVACEKTTDARGRDGYEYCQVKLAPRRYVLFSKDPIRSIAMARRPM